MLIADDPEPRNYLRAPYDPTYGIHAIHVVTRGVLDAATASGARRIGAATTAAPMTVGCVIGLALVVEAVFARERFWELSVVWGLLFAGFFGAFALAIWRRLWRSPRASRTRAA